MNLSNCKSKIIFCLTLGLFIHFQVLAQNNDSPNSITWDINSIVSIDGNQTNRIGDPVIVETPDGKAVWFDGIDDGLIVESNPLEGIDSAFTIEVIFKPDSSYPENQEQRFIHFQNPASDNRRVLIELRLTNDHQWYLDTYIKSENSSLALKDANSVHPIGGWYHAALVYDNGKMEHFVNGVNEISGNVEFLPINNGHTSIGTRMNKVHWYKGLIRKLKVTARALAPEEFLININALKNELSPSPNFRLLQNYPNPFNPSTKISFSIPKPEQVTIEVYNALGQRIAIVLNRKMSAGAHQTEFNGRNMPSGVYFYKLIAGEFQQVRKMVLLK